jgi:hypothetical protein
LQVIKDALQFKEKQLNFQWHSSAPKAAAAPTAEVGAQGDAKDEAVDPSEINVEDVAVPEV